MIPINEAQREARARRTARNLDLIVRKSRRDGSYGLLNAYNDTWVVPPGVNYDLDVLEQELAEPALKAEATA